METRKLRLRKPSPAMIVALVALVFAMSGTAVAASKLVSGDKLIKKNSLSGNRLRNNTVTGAKIKVSTLGKVPSAVSADTAATATTVVDGAITPAKIGSVPGALVHRTAAMSFPTSGASQWLSFDTVDFNVGAVFDAASPTRLRAPIAGRYLIVSTVRWAANATGRRTIALAVNQSTVIARSNVSAYYNGGTALQPEQTVEAIYKLNAGDYVEAYGMQDSGGPLGLVPDTPQGSTGVTFSMQWLAPAS